MIFSDNKLESLVHGTNTKAGRLFDLILLGVILLSLFLIIMETVEGFNAKYHQPARFSRMDNYCFLHNRVYFEGNFHRQTHKICF